MKLQRPRSGSEAVSRHPKGISGSLRAVGPLLTHDLRSPRGTGRAERGGRGTRARPSPRSDGSPVVLAVREADDRERGWLPCTRRPRRQGSPRSRGSKTAASDRRPAQASVAWLPGPNDWMVPLVGDAALVCRWCDAASSPLHAELVSALEAAWISARAGAARARIGRVRGEGSHFQYGETSLNAGRAEGRNLRAASTPR